MLRRLAVLIALVAAFAAGAVTTANAVVPSMPGVVASLQRNPVYVDPHADPPHVDGAQLRKAMPPQTYFADLPRSSLSADGDPAAVPALLSSRVGRGGTFIVLLGGQLYGASTLIPGRLGEELASAQSVLPATGDATGAVIALMRSLAGEGGAQDNPSPSRAGGPVGAGVLVAIVVVVVVGALALWWWLRRKPGPRRRRRKPAPPRDLVEVDYTGRIIRRVPASERENDTNASQSS